MREMVRMEDGIEVTHMVLHARFHPRSVQSREFSLVDVRVWQLVPLLLSHGQNFLGSVCRSTTQEDDCFEGIVWD